MKFQFCDNYTFAPELNDRDKRLEREKKIWYGRMTFCPSLPVEALSNQTTWVGGWTVGGHLSKWARRPSIYTVVQSKESRIS